MTQLQQLLAHFAQRPDISNVEAQAMFRIRALPRRISDLTAKGYRFGRSWRTDTTGQRYVRYHYLGKKAAA